MSSGAASVRQPTRGPQKHGGRDGWLALGLALAGFVLAAWTRQDTAFAMDQNNYLGGAEALAAGLGYREAYVEGLPRCTIYPPLFPAYLAVGWRFGEGWPSGLQGVAVGQWLLSGASGALTFLLLRRQGVAPRWALPVTLLFLTSSCWHIMVNGLFSESLMQPLVLGMLCWLWAPTESRTRRPVAFHLGLGVMLALLYLTRSAATAMVGGSLLVVLARIRWFGWARVAAVFLPCVVAVLAWKAWTAGGSKTYASTFLEVVRDVMGPWGYAQHVGRNLLSVATGRDVIAALCPFWARAPFLPGLAGGPGGVLQVVLGVAGGLGMGVAMFGLWRRRQGNDAWLAGIAGLYLLQNVLWWYWLGDRGMLVLLPLLAVWFHAGARGFGEGNGFRRLRWAVAATLAVGLTINAALLFRTSTRPGRDRIRTEIEETARWVREQATERDVIVATSDIPLLHFTHGSGRRVVGVAGSQIPVVPGAVPTLAVVRTRPNPYMPQPASLGETLFTSSQGVFAVRRVVATGP